MLLNYLKIAFRNIARHKVYTVLNIAGLAVGMTCAILLLLFVRDELSYDRHNSKHPRIYNVQSHFRFADDVSYNIGSPYPLAAALKDEYPSILESVRLFHSDRIYFVDDRKETIGEDAVFYADPGVFRIFDHRFIYGSPENLLNAPHTIVINETLSKKYFGDQNPVGQVLSKINGSDYVVQGVFQDLPENSSTRYDALLSKYDLWEDHKHTATQGDIGDIDSRRPQDFFSIYSRLATYILIAENQDIAEIENDFERFKEKYFLEFAKQQNMDFDPVFLPLGEVHLRHDDFGWQVLPFNLLRVYMLTFLAALILMSACVNYVNIATARSSDRAMEVGIRKALGAGRGALVIQFIGESMIVAMTALFVSIASVELLLPGFNTLSGKGIDFGILWAPSVMPWVFGLAVMVGLASGSYPAFFLSSSSSADLTKNSGAAGPTKGTFRKILVVFQCAITVAAIILTLLHREQVDYISNLDRGFDCDDILVISPKPPEGVASLETLQNELDGNTMITAVARSNTNAGNVEYSEIHWIEDDEAKLVQKTASFLVADSDFIELMGIEILEGRNFSDETGPDPSRSFLVNETLVKEMGWSDSPVGKKIRHKTVDGFIIGVVKDVSFYSWRKTQPMVIVSSGNNAINEMHLSLLNIRIRPDDPEKTVAFIEKRWSELNPETPFEFNFLGDFVYGQSYHYEKLNQIFIYFSLLSIVISSLGLFGLSSFVAESRTKEIGIRKVLGASTWNILLYLSFDFIKLVLISILIAAPVTYYGIAKWQELLPQQAGLTPWALVIASSIALAIALLTVGYHAIKVSLTDPVKALR
jgi:putative ABC transport system permease protein